MAAVDPLRLPEGTMADEATVAEYLRAQGVEPYAWSNGPGDRYASHAHAYTKLLMCAAGSIAFSIGETRVELRPGDRFVLPPGVVHAADVGPAGVTCLEGDRR